jgi:hypothetical protein
MFIFDIAPTIKENLLPGEDRCLPDSFVISGDRMLFSES